MNYRVLSQKLGEYYLDFKGSFLPPKVPEEHVPPAFQAYELACQELAEYFHGEHKSARRWLNEKFKIYDPELDTMIQSTLSVPQLEKLNTILSILAHAYRWDSVPTDRSNYQPRKFELPAGIARPWYKIIKILKQPPVGTTYSMILSNWSLQYVRPDRGYSYEELQYPNLYCPHTWLKPPQHLELQAFFLSLVETEARGAASNRTCIKLVQAVLYENPQEVMYRLDRLEAELQLLNRPFKHFIKRQHVSPQSFRQLIQPVLGWGLEDPEYGMLEGPSGAQLGCLQMVDAVLSLPRKTPMSKAIVHTRCYMPPAHRDFLDHFDEVAKVVRIFVERSKDRKMIERFNQCGKARKAWRRIHQRRGLFYIRGGAKQAGDDFISTGLTISAGTEKPDVAFAEAMEEVIRETEATAIVTAQQSPQTTVEIAFRYLTDEDLQALFSGSEHRFYKRGEQITQMGIRGDHIYRVYKGNVREIQPPSICGNPNVSLGILSQGEIFGVMSFLENDGTLTTKVAESDVQIDIIPREHIYELMHSREGFSLRFYQSLLALLSHRLRSLHIVMSDLLHREEPNESYPLHQANHSDDMRLRSLPPPSVSLAMEHFLTNLKHTETRILNSQLSPQQAQLAIDQACNELLVLWNQHGGDNIRHKTAISRYLFRESLRMLGQSNLIHTLLFFSRTYPHFSILNLLYQNDEQGDGILGPLIDRWVRLLPSFYGLRQARIVATQQLQAHLDAWLKPELMPVLTLGFGPMTAMIDILPINTAKRIECIAFDYDQEAIDYGSKRALQKGLSNNFTFIKENLFRLGQRLHRLSMSPRQFVYVDIALSTLSERSAVHLLNWIYEHLQSGGVLLLANLSYRSPDRHFLADLLSWPIYRRIPEALVDIISESNFALAPVHTWEGDEGGVVFALCKKM